MNSLVRQNPQELDLLFKELLIVSPTSSATPPCAGTQSSVLPELLARSNHSRFAAGVGCSTGEEAYSPGDRIGSAEAHAKPEPWTLQIFATDLSADGNCRWRRGGHYPRRSQRYESGALSRFSAPTATSYLIGKDIAIWCCLPRTT